MLISKPTGFEANATIFHLSHKNDPVPGLPPWELEYVHWGPQ